ncbi:MAG TPA: polysaccharide deacetylase family protein [Arthrobacter sp.]|nr:polysaccharide deacetylase family protein [Arthrobacter sp.]
MGDIRGQRMPGRRAVLLGMAGFATAALSGCVAAGHATGDAEPSTQAIDQAIPARSRTAPAPLPIGEPDRPALPTKQQIVAEFANRKPQEWGLQVTGVVTQAAAGAIALTFDACGGPGGAGFDHELIGTLQKLHVPATLFLNERWIQANPDLTKELAANPLFELANHGFLHRPLSVNGKSAYDIAGTADLGQVYDEVTGNQKVLQDITGRLPRFFRPGTAYYDEVAAAVTRRLGLQPVNFSINGDAGATLAPAAVASSVASARPGDIVIAHFNKPGSGTAAGFRQALPRLQGGGTTFARLGEVLPAL